jgi:hypothetical protein
VTALSYDGQFAVSLLGDNNMVDMPLVAAGVRAAFEGYIKWADTRTDQSSQDDRSRDQLVVEKPPEIVFATAVDRQAPTRLRKAPRITAVRGRIAPVAIGPAIALALSRNPLV